MELAVEVLGELGGGAASAGNGVEISSVCEDDGVAIGRDGGIAKPLGGFGLEHGRERSEK